MKKSILTLPLGGLPIAAGLGYNAPEWVGAGMAFGGVLVSLVLMLHSKRSKEEVAQLQPA